ncbi:MAG: Gfo/Idh/MocA family oxidoreductase [Candidatus Marinimicrobia bacterium]|jgi:predicted dehydrogenase|nr:Gfo/Idh/MocA family oxidoreductase [Candidatus Neomarinimicrobiota bacterium]MDP7026305.1 Gfo/Idh/MocA family oxidoreductase [Candidatus Neomarinimicrobiota bacterium]
MSIGEHIIRIGVVGVGHLGLRHLEHALELKSADCTGFFDTDDEQTDIVSRKTGATAHKSLTSLLDATDIISIVVPTVDHFSIAKECIENGKHVFIEKPMCKTVKEADTLLDLAEKNGVQIHVGHIERLNPALVALNGIELTPRYIETHRLAPYTARGTDVPVVLDLMIHDLDVIISLVKSPVKTVSASGVSIMTDSVDIANARITFESGCIANVTSSRIAKEYVRKLRIFQQDMYVTIDFLRGLTEVYRLLDAEEEDPDAVFSAPLVTGKKTRQIVYETPPVRKVDALQLELENFVASVNGESTPIVSGKEGREALAVALQIQAKIEQTLH